MKRAHQKLAGWMLRLIPERLVLAEAKRIRRRQRNLRYPPP